MKAIIIFRVLEIQTTQLITKDRRGHCVHNQQTRELISARHTYATTKIWVANGTLTWHASKYKVHELHQRYMHHCVFLSGLGIIVYICIFLSLLSIFVYNYAYLATAEHAPLCILMDILSLLSTIVYNYAYLATTEHLCEKLCISCHCWACIIVYNYAHLVTAEHLCV